MTHNPEEAKRQKDSLSNDAQRAEILDVLLHHGPCYVADIVKRTGFKPTEVRWHLQQLKDSGQAGFNFVTMRYSL